MSNPQDDGGRAFPTQGYDSPNHGWIYGSDGMYLRDYFAAAALTGLLASGEFLADRLLENPDLTVGSIAYKAADESLAARKEGA